MRKMTKPMILVPILLITINVKAQYLTPDERLDLTPYERESLKIQGQMQRDAEYRDTMEQIERWKQDRRRERREWMDAGKGYDSYESDSYDSDSWD